MKQNMKQILLFLVLISVQAFAYADKPPVFIGGLHEKDLTLCYQKVWTLCNIDQFNPESLSCLKQQMLKQKICDQGLAFLEAANGVVEKIEHHRYMDLVYASVIAADHSDDVFMIAHSGELINLLGTPDLNIKKASGYSKIAKRFSDPMLWPVVEPSLGFPKYRQLKSGGDSIILEQQMTNQCHACERAGKAQVAYDFDTKGEFIGQRKTGLPRRSAPRNGERS
jgi:hypothetical protein